MTDVRIHGGMKVLGSNPEIKNLELEELSTDPPDVKSSRIWLNTTENRIKYGEGINNGAQANIKSLANLNDIVTLNNLLDNKANTTDLATLLSSVFENKNINIQTHISDTNNPHNVSADQISFDNSNNPWIVGDKLQSALDTVAEIHKLTTEPSGFVNRTSSTLSFDKTTRTFTITPITSFDIYVGAKKITITEPKTYQISDVQGNHYIYFDADGNLNESTTFNGLFLSYYAYVTIIHWNIVQQQHLFCGDERHGVVMDGTSHSFIHSAIGTQYMSGLALTPLVIDGDGSLDTHAQFSISNGKINDEDISFDIINGEYQILSSVMQIPVWYRYGSGNWYRNNPDSFAFIHSGSTGVTYSNIDGLPAINYYNNITSQWEVKELSNPNNYFCMHFGATPCYNPGPLFAITGTTGYSSIAEAVRGGISELDDLLKSNLIPTAELVSLYTVVFYASATLTNNVKCKTVTANVTNPVLKYIGNKFARSIHRNEHSMFNGLDKDDHLQYPLTTGGHRPNLNLNSPTDGQVMKYSAISNKWINSNEGITQALPAVKQIFANDISYVTGSALIPYDNTAPLITEGTQIHSQTITPTDIGTTIIVDVFLVAEVNSSNRNLTLSIFRTVNGVSTLVGVSSGNLASANRAYQIGIRTTDLHNTTNTITYTIRIGADISTTWKVNKADGGNGSFGSTLLKNNGVLFMEF